MKWKLTDGSEGCALYFSAWWRQDTAGDPRGRDYIIQRLKSETVSGKKRTLGAQLATRDNKIYFTIRRIMPALSSHCGIHWRFGGATVGIKRARVGGGCCCSSCKHRRVPRARVLQRLGFVQESVPCRPASASSPKRHPTLRQSVAGISGRLSHFVSALHPYLASPGCSQPFGISIGVL